MKICIVSDATTAPTRWRRRSGVAFALGTQLVATGRFLTILPVAIFKLKHRTASPVVEKFVEHLRAAAKSMAAPA